MEGASEHIERNVDMENNRPKNIKLGNVQAAIWPAEKGKKSGVSIERHYQHGQEWKTTSRFDLGDLPVVAFLALVSCWWTLRRDRAFEDQEQA